ncbi:MAG: hypothetical protein AB7E61_07070 [Acholeplasmataceae bacterium]
MEEFMVYKNWCKQHGYNEKDANILHAYLHGNKCQVCGKLIQTNDKHFEHDSDHVFYCNECGSNHLVFCKELDAYIEDDASAEFIMDDAMSDLDKYTKKG